MTLGRLWRTGRHLGTGQLLAIAQRRVRHAVWQRWPDTARRRLVERAARLEQPDPRRPAVAALARHVATLQSAIHPDPLDRLRHGCFEFLGRRVDFGSLEHIDWRRDLGEANSPLWRLTLAYFGWAVPLLAAGHADDHRVVPDGEGSPAI